MKRIVATVLLLLLAACNSAAAAEEQAKKGMALARAGKLDEAIVAFHSALERAPENPRARYNLGIALLSTGRAQEAATHFARFAEARPRDELGHFSHARALAAAGRHEEAIGALQRAVVEGFAHHEALKTPEFKPLEQDLRFVQLEVVVAQRAGKTPALATDFAGRAGANYGGERLLGPAPLPGSNINRADSCIREDGTACFPEAAAPF